MTGSPKEARQRAGLASRVSALGDAASLSEGRGDDRVVAEARRVVQQVDQRLAFSGDDTVVALAGATGSGKSSVFNAIAGRQLAEPGVKRPTTSKGLAADRALSRRPSCSTGSPCPAVRSWTMVTRRWPGWCCWTCPTTIR